MEHVLRQCLIALRLAGHAGLGEQDRMAVYYTALLVNVGCHADAHEQAKWFGDDITLKSGKYAHELGSVRGALATVRLVGAGNPAAASVPGRARVRLRRTGSAAWPVLTASARRAITIALESSPIDCAMRSASAVSRTARSGSTAATASAMRAMVSARALSSPSAPAMRSARSGSAVATTPATRAITPAGGPPSPAPLWDDAARQVIVQFLDGTWRLCRLIEWRTPAPGCAISAGASQAASSRPPTFSTRPGPSS